MLLDVLSFPIHISASRKMCIQVMQNIYIYIYIGEGHV